VTIPDAGPFIDCVGWSGYLALVILFGAIREVWLWFRRGRELKKKLNSGSLPEVKRKENDHG
jgi:hypothetical protein